MVVVILGSGGNQVTFQKVLEWEEVKTTRVSRLGVLGGQETTEPDTVLVTPKQITLTVRLTSPQMTTLRALKAEHAWQPLNDDGALVDYVWIKVVKPRWTGTDDKTRPWLTQIGLVASND